MFYIFRAMRYTADFIHSRLSYTVADSETRSSTTAAGTFKLASDVNFSHNPSTSAAYNRYVGKQNDWGTDYAAAHEKMSLLGIEKTTLTDCTELLPQPINLATVQVATSGGKVVDPAIDPVLLEAAI
ncbi:hypothetical protein B0H17DRAFT_304771 [Mycena rosella]|uniref:Uncharacterized protein n=1 Tax=Mycena rosella TaxID=1033263 RepID=A0AAD7CUH2_MYCRO|nr:hypothetical protein B0H17DRAFT_304771 [Mycena rosella]